MMFDAGLTPVMFECWTDELLLEADPADRWRHAACVVDSPWLVELSVSPWSVPDGLLDCVLSVPPWSASRAGSWNARGARGMDFPWCARWAGRPGLRAAPARWNLPGLRAAPALGTLPGLRAERASGSRRWVPLRRGAIRDTCSRLCKAVI